MVEEHVYIFLTEGCSKEMWQFPSFGVLSQIFYSNMIILLNLFGLLTHLGDSREFLLKLVLAQCSVL